MRFGRGAWTAVGLIAMFAIFAAWVPARAQEGGGAVAAGSAAKQSGAATIKVYTRETVVDVTVTDKNGKPVRGLTRAEFTVTEDDKPQSIRSFKEFDSATPATAPTSRKLPANTYTNLVTGTGPLTVLLLDDINGGDIPQARWAAAKFIKSMAPGTRVAMLALGDRLTVLQGPTTDPALLLKVVNAYVKPFSVVEDPCRINHGWATLDQLKEVATFVSGIKGRKNLIWIGNGIPYIVFSTLLKCYDWVRPLQGTYDLLENAQVTVYPLEPNGVVAPTSGPTDFRGNPVAGAQDSLVYMAQNSAYAGPRLAMEAVAEATGGEALYNTNDLVASLTKATEHGSDYYTLSYASPHVEYDGKDHAISIKVDRPGVHLLYRKGYSAEDPMLIRYRPETLLGHVTRDTRPTGPPADPLAAALSPIAPPATQLLFDVRVEPSMDPANPLDPPVFGVLDPKYKKAPLTRYGLLFAVPQSQIAFADTGGGTYSGSLKFDVAAFDADDKMVSSRSQTMKLPLTNEEYQQFIAAPFQLYQQLDLPPGEFMLRVGVLDGVSNKLGTVQIPLTVGKATAASTLGGTAQR